MMFLVWFDDDGPSLLMSTGYIISMKERELMPAQVPATPHSANRR
jgi:hypothetical protein